MDFRSFIKDLIPTSIKSWLNYKDYTPFQQIAFSQEGEDLLIDHFLIYKRNGSYIDIGANHPFKGSNTFFFYLNRDWKGLVIDPIPTTKHSFEKHRPNDIVVQCGIGEENSSMTFYVMNESMISSFSKDLIDRRLASNPNYVIEKEVEVPIYTLKSILDKNWEEGRKIDLMSIDTENHDLSVLKSNDWNKYRPSFIIVHDKQLSLDHTSDSAIHNFLLTQKYRLRSRCFCSTIYTIEDL